MNGRIKRQAKVAWFLLLNWYYQAKEPGEGIAGVMVRDIARIITPDHIPFVYENNSEPSVSVVAMAVSAANRLIV